MATAYIYDIDTGVFLSEQGMSVAVTPSIHFGTRPVWQISLRHSDGSIPDLSAVVAFRAAIDTDFNSATEPLCRTISGITYDQGTGLLTVPLDACTANFQSRCNGRQRTNGYFEVHGSDTDGYDIFYFIFNVVCRYVIDPDGSTAISPSTGEPMTQAEVAAIASQVLHEQADTIQGPPGPAAPNTIIQFSADAANWHADWTSGDTFIRFSTDNGDTWRDCQMVPASSTLTVAEPWRDNAIYPAGTLVTHGSPASLYQATARVSDFTEPGAEGDELWRVVCQGLPGETGPAGATWLTGHGAPSQYSTAASVDDHYLDLDTYNHYICTATYLPVDGATPPYIWTQQGSLKGADGTGINYRGAWDSTAAYHIGDAVTHNGSLWRAYADNAAYPPPTDTDGESPCWQLFLAAIRGPAGTAGSIEIAQVTMEDPTYSAWAQELSYSTTSRRAYNLHLPRGSAGPAGQTTFTVNPQPSDNGLVSIENLEGSTPYNRIYRLTLPRGLQGETGKGLQIDYIGTLAERVLYDSAVTGMTFAATDVLTDDNGLHYQALYVKTDGGWSDPIRLYMGAQGPQGEQGEQGLPGAHGLAPAQEDRLFTAADLIANALYLDGDMPLASVEIAGEDGNWTALHPGQDYAVRTSIALGKTIIAFGPDSALDFTYGGRVRYAQGKVAEAITIAVAVQYSQDAESWHSEPAAGDAFIRVSADNGLTWGTPIQLQLPAAGVPEAPQDGKLYARCNGAWVEVTGGSTPDPTPSTSTYRYGIVPYSVAGAITSVTQLTQAMLDAPASSVTTATAQAATGLSLGAPNAGDWLFVLLPADSALAAAKFDGLSEYVPFGTGVPVAGTEANGTAVAIGGTSYKIYGEWAAVSAEYLFRLA